MKRAHFLNIGRQENCELDSRTSPTGSRIVITQRFTDEFDRRTVGIAVRVPGGFVFYSSDDRFEEIDGQMFPRARAIERELRLVAKRSKRQGPAAQASPSLA